MALDNNLKDEEIAGGFDPNSDSETFLADRQRKKEPNPSRSPASPSPRQTNRLLIIPLVLLILSGIAIAGYYLFFYEKNSEIKRNELQEAENTKDVEAENKQNIDSQKVKSEIAKSVESSSNINYSSFGNQMLLADNYSEKENNFKNEFFFFEQIPKAKRKIQSQPKPTKILPKIPAQPKSQEKKTDSIITKKQQPTKPQEKTKVVPKDEKNQPAKPIITKKEEPKIQKPTTSEKSDFVSPIPETGNYTIQLLATPSKEEAEILLNKLKSKNIEKTYITTQKKRDIIWYRVRVGNYKTMNEAQEAAKTNGWIQFWIDRIK